MKFIMFDLHGLGNIEGRTLRFCGDWRTAAPDWAYAQFAPNSSPDARIEPASVLIVIIQGSPSLSVVFS
jgi:hypothetical protein